MADSTISALTAATSVTASDLVPIVQGGTNKKATADMFAAGTLITPGGTGNDKLGEFAAADNSGNGDGTVFIDKGTALLSNTFTVTSNSFNLVGMGKQTTILYVNPGSAMSAVKFDRGGEGNYDCSISKLSIWSDPANTQTKTALELVNVAEFEVTSFKVDNWAGSASIGIRTRGREMVRLRDCNITCARPFVMSPNTTYPELDTDFFHADGCLFYTDVTSGIAVEMEDGVNYTNMFFHHCDFIGGKTGFKMANTTDAASPYQLTFDNCRQEQVTDATGWNYDISTTASEIRNITFRNCMIHRDRNGVKLRGCKEILFLNCDFSDSVNTVIDITGIQGTVVTFINCHMTNGATMTMTNLKRLHTYTPAATASPIGFHDTWIYDDGTDYTGQLVLGTILSGKMQSMNNAAIATLASNHVSGFIDLVVDDYVARYAVTSHSNVVTEISDPSNKFSVTKDTASSFNIYWDAGSSTYKMQNNMGGTVEVRYIINGRAYS
jgi:hypothetical protein